MSLKKNSAIRDKANSKLHSIFQSKALKGLLLASVAAGTFFSFSYLEKYVKQTVALDRKTAALELVEAPWWLCDSLREKIYSAAVAGGENLRLDDDVAESVRRNLTKTGGWLGNVKTQTTSRSIRIWADWRKPLALVKAGDSIFFLDENMSVLDYVEVPALPIVSITGFTQRGDLLRAARNPALNKIEDIKAAVEILSLLDKRDSIERRRGLLYEIARIDVSNFGGRLSPEAPHIVLYTADDTEIIWGAEIGKWHRHLEVTDEQKIARLYSYFNEKKTLLGGPKVINLRDPQQTVPLPIDRYTPSEN